jgi:hypothetical protein
VHVSEQDLAAGAGVLATVTGWRGSSGWTHLDGAQLDQAIRLLEQFEPDGDTLAAWRYLRSWSGVVGESLVVIFDLGPARTTIDPYVLALRDVVASGRQRARPGGFHPLPAAGHSDHPLRRLWDWRWPRTPPIGYWLRRDPDRWVRFPSLPGGKRYADDEAEYDILLDRHETVLDELRGDADELLVITTELSFTPRTARRRPLADALLPGAEPWSVLSWPGYEPELAFAHAFVNEVTWKPGGLDELLRAVADEQLAYVLLAPPDLSWLYAPYDGGADVLLADSGARDELRRRHLDWLRTATTARA